MSMPSFFFPFLPNSSDISIFSQYRPSCHSSLITKGPLLYKIFNYLIFFFLFIKYGNFILYPYLYLYLYVVESLLGYETTGERAQLVAYGAATC